MALENAESDSDASKAGVLLNRAPDSGRLQVSLNTQFESGIPPARAGEPTALEHGVERMEVALAGVTRSEANLKLLIRGMKHLAAGAQAARDANTELTHQLDLLHSHLMHKNEAEHALYTRTVQLEHLLDVVRHESLREREFLIEQQDLFLVEILTDHERQLTDLKRACSEMGARSSDARQREREERLAERAELMAQRDQAREYAARCERERDAAMSGLAAGKTMTTANHAPVSEHPDSGYSPPGADASD